MVESSPATTASQAVDSDLNQTGPDIAYPVSNQLISLVRKLNCFDVSPHFLPNRPTKHLHLIDVYRRANWAP